MDEIVHDKVKNENDFNIKHYWDIAMGFQKVDNLIPSNFFYVRIVFFYILQSIIDGISSNFYSNK